jgi:hypothetical protein
MSDNQYPVYVSGQTLTAPELNALRDFLHARDRIVGRLVGFGVNAGLGAAVSGTAVTVVPGLAVDQTGEPLLLAAPLSITLPPAADTTTYDFVDAGKGGFSLVIEATDVTEPTPDCGQANCAGHAELHTKAATVRAVAGRVTGTRLDFADEPLLRDEKPIRLLPDSTPDTSPGHSSFNGLRDEIATRLMNQGAPVIDPARIAKLQGTGLATADTAGIKGYKCGWLNMVLFATVDLLRVLALLAVTADRPTSRPGVVLGWLSQTDQQWVFDCAFRHDWEPPRGLTDAVFGGTCVDPAKQYRDELEAVIDGYNPPVLIPVGDPLPPKGCPKGSIKYGKFCIPVAYPPKQIPEKWANPWIEKTVKPLGPLVNPVVDVGWKEPWKVYQTGNPTFFEDGVLGATDLLGYDKDKATAAAQTAIAAAGGVQSVHVLAVGDALPAGYAPDGVFAVSDQLVLTVDSTNKVVATGKVPAVVATRAVAGALPAAQEAVTQAKAVAEDLRQVAGGLQGKVEGLTTKVDGFNGTLATFQTDFEHYKGGAFDTAGFGVRIATLENVISEQKATLDKVGVIQGQVDVITRQIPSRGVVRGIDADLGRSIADFAGTAVEALRAIDTGNNPALRDRIAAVAQAHRRLGTVVTGGDPATIGEATLALLTTVREAFGAAGVSQELGQRLDVHLRNLGGLIR